MYYYQDGGSEMLEAVQSAKRRRAILEEIAHLGPVVPGTISQRTTRCAGPGCHCRADPPVLHGPYPTWTHQAGGRQVTKTLSAEQAERLGPAIEANRRLHQLVKELEALSVADFEATRSR
jgi:hypothetical protein